MGMPGWAFGLGALLKGPEYINTGLDLYRGIRDDRANQANNQAARDTVDNLAWAAQEEDPAVRLENFREVSRDMTGRPVNADTALKLQKEIDAQSKGTLADVKTAQAQSQLEQFQKDAAASGKDLVTFAMENPAKIPLVALQGANSVFSTLATVTEKEAERRNKEQKEQDKQVNLSAFQKSISSLTGPAQSPSEQRRLSQFGGYDPNGEADIRMAGADYNIPASDVNAAVSDYQGKMEKTPTGAPTPYKMGTGRSTETGLLQNFVLGAPKNIANTTSVSPVVKVTAPGESGPVAQTSFVDPDTGKPLVFDKRTGTYRIAKVEGGVAPKPNAMSPEAATRAQQYDTILANIPKIRAMVFDKDGNIDKINIANSQIGTPLTKGREIKQMVKRTIEQALRIATGAAAPESEVASYMDMYAPQVGDTKEMIKAKLDALESFAGGTKEKYSFGKPPQAAGEKQQPRPIAPAGTKARVNGKILTSDGKGGWR